jgi:tetratricopeptide (TPR) repeat protein
MQRIMTPTIRLICCATLALALQAQTTPPAGTRFEATSPLGTKLYSLPDDKGAVTAAVKALAADPKNVKLMLALSQAQASAWQEKEAVATCTRALTMEPDNADLLIERGHRELPLREFVKAKADLAKAAQLDATKSEAYYHLGLAHYFLGEFAPAADAFCHGLGIVTSQDSIVNFTNWCYASLRRAGKQEEAAKALEKVPSEMKSNEGHTVLYYNLVRFFQGLRPEDRIVPPGPPFQGPDTEAELQFDTVGYGVGNWHLYNGEPEKAREYFTKIAQGKVWVTWGFVGAETELARMKK